MVKLEDTVFCDGCGVEIPLAPVIKNEQEYCCEDCAQGYECTCAEQMEIEEPTTNDRSRNLPAGSPLY